MNKIVHYFVMIMVLTSHQCGAMDAIEKKQTDQQVEKKSRRPDYVYDKFSGEDIQTYCAARSLANSIVAAVSCQKIGKNDSVQDYYEHSFMNIDTEVATVRAGLELGFLDGVPCQISTKWGRWQFVDGSYATEDQKSFLVAATLRLISLEQFKTIASQGSCNVSLRAVGKRRITQTESARLTPQEKIAQWRTLTAWYNTPKKPSNKKNGTLDIIEAEKLRARL